MRFTGEDLDRGGCSIFSAAACGWRMVKRPAEFSLDDLRKRLGQRSLTATIECSGNFGEPRFMNGLVSTATWTGISLAEVLEEECVPEPEARKVVSSAWTTRTTGNLKRAMRPTHRRMAGAFTFRTLCLRSICWHLE